MVQMEIQALPNLESFKEQYNKCSAKGHNEAACWQTDENAHKQLKNWTRKDARTEVKGSNVEKLLAYIYFEEKLAFEVISGSSNDWKEKVQGFDASGPSNKYVDEQCNMDEWAKTISSLIDTFEGLSTVEWK